MSSAQNFCVGCAVGAPKFKTPDNSTIEDDLLAITVEETLRRLSIKRPFFYSLVQKGHLLIMKIGKKKSVALLKDLRDQGGRL
jgi:hypothetical protein